MAQILRRNILYATFVGRWLKKRLYQILGHSADSHDSRVLGEFALVNHPLAVCRQPQHFGWLLHCALGRCFPALPADCAAFRVIAFLR
jgi:hypothetical protein